MKIKAPFRELSERVSTALNRERIKEVNLFEGFLVFEKCGQVNYNTAERFDRTVGDVKGYYEDGCEAESLSDPKINKYKLELEDEDVVADPEDSENDDLEIKDPEDLDDLDDDGCECDCDPEDTVEDEMELEDDDDTVEDELEPEDEKEPKNESGEITVDVDVYDFFDLFDAAEKFDVKVKRGKEVNGHETALVTGTKEKIEEFLEELGYEDIDYLVSNTVKESKNDIKSKLDKIVKDFANVRESSVIRKLREAARAKRKCESLRIRKIDESGKYEALRAKYKALRKQH